MEERAEDVDYLLVHCDVQAGKIIDYHRNEKNVHMHNRSYYYYQRSFYAC